MEQNQLLEIRNLNVKFPMDDQFIHASNGVNMKINRGETLGVVGESGCGKSVSLSSIMRLVKAPPAVISGEILFEGRDILTMPETDLHKIRGKEITMIFQEPMTCLNPVIRIGNQIVETLILHEKMNKDDAMKKAVDLLKLVGIPDPEERIRSFPHQLSGGLRQRVMIAMALACKPKILLADEPTTALDVTIQAQILDLLKNIKKEVGMSIAFVTHDLGVVAEIADRVVVFYAGRIVEEADTRSLYKTPLHPYTEGLLGCIPKITTNKERLSVIDGNVPDPIQFPSGCPFHPRCKYCKDICSKEEPKMQQLTETHFAACHFAKERLEDYKKEGLV